LSGFFSQTSTVRFSVDHQHGVGILSAGLNLLQLGHNLLGSRLALAPDNQQRDGHQQA
jgi:hypothetical protein